MSLQAGTIRRLTRLRYVYLALFFLCVTVQFGAVLLFSPGPVHDAGTRLGFGPATALIVVGSADFVVGMVLTVLMVLVAERLEVHWSGPVFAGLLLVFASCVGIAAVMVMDGILYRRLREASGSPSDRSGADPPAP